VIKLPTEASADDHLALVALLNSSTACFWLKQVSHDKGSQGVNEGFKSQAWERFYQFNGKKVEQFPLPVSLPLEFGQALDTLAQELARVEPAAICAEGYQRASGWTRPARHTSVCGLGWSRGRGVGLGLLRRYGLLNEAEAAGLIVERNDLPELRLGERAFEIVLAQAMEDGEAESQWFRPAWLGAGHRGSDALAGRIPGGRPTPGRDDRTAA